MVSGALTIIIWYNVPVLKKLIYELVPGFFISLIVIVIVSIISPPKKAEEKSYKEAIEYRAS